MDTKPVFENPVPHPAVLFGPPPGPLPSPRSSTPWALGWSPPETSLVYRIHIRYFASSLGRFQKPDSIFDGAAANPQGWNLYTYVKGNPVNFNDPTGHVIGLAWVGKGNIYVKGQGGIQFRHDDLGGGLGLSTHPWDANHSGGRFDKYVKLKESDFIPVSNSFEQVTSGTVGPVRDATITKREYWINQGVPEKMVDDLMKDLASKLANASLYTNNHEAAVGIAVNLKTGTFAVKVERSTDPEVVTGEQIEALIDAAWKDVGGANIIFGGHAHGSGALEGPSDDVDFANNRTLTRNKGDIAAAIKTENADRYLKGHVLLWTNSGQGNMYVYEANAYLKLQ